MSNIKITFRKSREISRKFFGTEWTPREKRPTFTFVFVTLRKTEKTA